MKKADKIQLQLNYGNAIAVLPSGVLSLIDKAKKFDLKVLFLVASEEKYRKGKYIEELASALSCTVEEIECAIKFWKNSGVINVADELATEDKVTKEVSHNEEKSVTPKRAKVTELPQYSSSELNSLLEKHKNVVDLIDECQNILGKIFTAADIKVLMALIDYLGLDGDYILVLMHYAARNDMKSLRYIEKIAVSCLDDGFTDAKSLQEELHSREERASIESKVKSMFGMGSRKLTSKEQKHINTWLNTYGFGVDIIEKAYEITINATNSPAVNYANKILEAWYAEGARTIDDVNAIIAKRQEEKHDKGSSFNVDEFFDAALKRSYSEDN